MSKQKDVAIIGIGNTIRMDDAAGIIIGQRVAEALDADFFEETTVDPGLLDLIDDYRLVVIVDSIKTDQFPAGTLLEISIEDLENPQTEFGPHRRNLPAIIELARNAEIPVEKKLKIYAIEILKNEEFGEELSQPVEDAIEPAIQEITTSVALLIKDTRNPAK